MKKPQKMEDDQFYRELPIWMQSMKQWMDHQMTWVKKEAEIHPLKGNGLT
jgi:hypothetical protein